MRDGVIVARMRVRSGFGGVGEDIRDRSLENQEIYLGKLLLRFALHYRQERVDTSNEIVDLILS